jgi:hypothetical protein
LACISHPSAFSRYFRDNSGSATGISALPMRRERTTLSVTDRCRESCGNGRSLHGIEAGRCSDLLNSEQFCRHARWAATRMDRTCRQSYPPRAAPRLSSRRRGRKENSRISSRTRARSQLALVHFRYGQPENLVLTTERLVKACGSMGIDGPSPQDFGVGHLSRRREDQNRRPNVCLACVSARILSRGSGQALQCLMVKRSRDWRGVLLSLQEAPPVAPMVRATFLPNVSLGPFAWQ